MNIIENFLVKNPCYKAGRKITVKGLMLHSVGCSQPNASVFIKNWNSESYSRACVHGFIDANNGNTYQTLPWNHRGWHAGSGTNGSANNTHIGVEMCEPDCITYTSGTKFTVKDQAKAKEMVTRTYNSAVELFAKLCKEYNLNPLADIISHKEGHAKGIASDHGDPEHLWKGVGLNYTMDTFRKAVKAKMNEQIPQPQPTPAPQPAPTPSAEYTNGIYKVNVDGLNIRKGPSVDYGVVGCITDKGKYTIVEIQNTSWGRLKSGAGWINCSKKYCTKTNDTPAPTPTPQPAQETLKVGDKVKLSANATVYGSTKKFSKWVYETVLYVRQINGDRIVISTAKTGEVTGAVEKKYLIKA